MKFLRTDLKRIFTEPAFYASLIIDLLLMAAGVVCNIEEERFFIKAQSFAFPFAAPLLAAMPYSVMIMTEKETSFDRLIFVKAGKFGYKYKRLAVCGISGAAALFIPEAILFLTSIAMGKSDFAADLPIIFLSLPFGFSYAVFAYALTFVNKKKYVPLIMPQVLYLLCTYAFPNLGLTENYPPLDISPSIYGGAIGAERFTIPLALTLSALILTALGKEGERR